MVFSTLSEIEVASLPYYGSLKDIREFFRSREPNRGERVFPTGFCHVASRIISKQTGLVVVAGYYTLSNGRLVDHGMNFDPARELYIDLTRSQFDPTAPAVLAEPVPRSRFERIDPLSDWARQWNESKVRAVNLASSGLLGKYLVWKKNRNNR